MIEIYTRPDCIFCTRAKELLKSKNMYFEEKILGSDYTRDWLIDSYPNAKTYPVIVIDGFHIGGYTELAKQLTEQTIDNRKFLSEG